LKLKNNKIIRGKISLKTGLHIGGSSETIEIGGMDNPVIKNPLTGDPYIPGSSLKGKMRSILEWKTGKIYTGEDDPGKPHPWCKDRDCPICRIFGTSDNDAKIGPTRLIIRDSYLSKEVIEDIKNKGLSLTEEKYENVINRITAKAVPRPLERVPAGISFEFEMVYRIFDIDNVQKTDEDLYNYVLHGLKFIERDTLGGSGSRGCGQVEFIDLTDEKGNSIDLNNIGEFTL